jgi:uncharacterized protein with HEPN domain
MWRDLGWVLDMLQASRRAIEHARGLDAEDFQASTLHQDAILRQFTIVGEVAKRVSAAFRVSQSEVLWRPIAGVRDVVVHDYARVDLQEVWRIVQEDLTELVTLLEPIVPSEEA